MDPLELIQWPPQVLWGDKGRGLRRRPHCSAMWLPMGRQPWYEPTPNMLTSHVLALCVSWRGGGSREPTPTERLVCGLLLLPVGLVALVCKGAGKLLEYALCVLSRWGAEGFLLFLLRLNFPMTVCGTPSPLQTAVQSIYILCCLNGTVVIGRDGQITRDGTIQIGPRINEAAVRALNDHIMRVMEGRIGVRGILLKGAWSITGSIDGQGRLMLVAKSVEAVGGVQHPC